MTTRFEVAIAGFVFAALAAGCSGGDDPPPDADSGSEMEPDAPEDTGEDEELTWQTEFVESGGWGLQVDLEAPSNGGVALAYFPTDGNRGEDCTEIGDAPPTKVRWPIHYARRSNGEWSVETVADPLYVGRPTGLDLELAPDGTPTLAAMTGQPLADNDYCGVNDTGLFRRQSKGNWNSENVVADSAAVAISKSGAADGPVVGNWPALAFDSSGDGGLVYKDVHFGGRQSDDFKIASLEIAVGSQGNWTPKSVDTYRGAGNRSQLLFDNNGNFVVAYLLPKESRTGDQIGVWVARSSDRGDSWQKVRLFGQGTTSRPAAAVDPETGTLEVLYYNSERGLPELATLEDPSKFEDLSAGWSIQKEDISNARYDAGYDPSVAYGPEGRLHAVYYRCTVASGGLGDCKFREDALVHAWRDAGSWRREVVDSGGGDGLCGMAPVVDFDASGRPVIAYRCERVEDGTVDRTAKFAIKK